MRTCEASVRQDAGPRWSGLCGSMVHPGLLFMLKTQRWMAARDGQGWAECARWGWSHRGILYFHVGTSEWTLSRFRKMMNHWIVGYPIFNDLQSSPYPETFRCVYPEFQVLDYLRHMAMNQYLLIPFLEGWTSIYQLFWCSPGVQGFDTLPHAQYRKHCHAPSHSGWKPLCCRRTTSQATSHGWKPGQVLEYLGLWQNSFHIYGSRNRIYIHSDHLWSMCLGPLSICWRFFFPHLARYFAVFPHVPRAWTLRASNHIKSMSRHWTSETRLY